MKKMIFITLVIMILFGKVYAFYDDLIEDNDEGVFVETISSNEVPNLNARAAILYDETFDRILYEKNAKQKRANASTTKMITALVAVENGNLNDIVQISQKAASTGGSTINLKKDDKITLGDLIKGLLIRSGNDAAVAIAEHISGNIELFSQLMNEKAEEIGAVDTNFITPHGLDEKNHYSTAYDLMLIAKEMLKDSFLSDVISCKTADITINGNTKTINTTNEMLSCYEGANGIKTGFTGEAGRCIITSAIRDNRQLISVVLGCDSKKNRTIDSTRLLNYGFDKYKIIDLGELAKNEIIITIEKSQEKLYKLSEKISFLYPLKEDEIKSIKVEYDIKTNLVAPLEKGQNVANIVFKQDNKVIKEIDYNLPQKVYRKLWKKFFNEIITDSFENYENMVEKLLKI